MPPRPPVTIRWSTRAALAADELGDRPRSRPARPRRATTRTPSASSRCASQAALVFDDVAGDDLVADREDRARPRSQCAQYAVSSPRRAHIPGRWAAAKPVRTRRCPATAMPPRSRSRGRARSPAPRRRTQPSEEGRFARRQPPEPPPSATRGGFLWSASRYAGAARPGVLSFLAAHRPPAAPSRRRSLAAADRLALADRDRGSVRDRRRQAGGRGRRPVELPGERAAHEALRLHAERRGDRRVQARPRRRLRRREPHRRGAREAEDPGARRADRRRRSPTPTRRSTQLGKATGHTRRRGGGRRADEGADRGDRRRRCRRPASRSPSTTSSTRLLLGDLEDVHRPRLHAARPEEHRRRGRQDGLRLPEALGRVHRRGRARR